MRKIKKGDIVGRISYGKDIFFIVEDIINLNKKEIAILKGLTIRIKADSPVEDLEILSKELIQNYEENLEKRFQERIQRVLPAQNKAGACYGAADELPCRARQG